MRMRALAIYGCLAILLVAAQPAPPPAPPGGDGWLSNLVNPAPDPNSALPWLRPGGRF